MLGLSYSLNRLRFHNNAPFRQVVRRHFQIHFVPERIPRETHSRFARDIRQDPMAVGQFHPIRLVRQNFDYGTCNFDGTLSGHVKISGSDSVMSTVCSKWADSEPSCVTTVQPSFKTFTPGKPALTIGSMASVIPGRSRSDFFPSTKFGICGSSWTARP